MDKTFNELFDDFFKRNNINNDNIDDSIKDTAKKMIDMLMNSNNISDVHEDIEKEMDAKLGKPDKIEFFNEGNLFFERRIWHTENGDIQKLTYSEDPTLIISPKQVNLEEELNKAIAAEEYEKAAAIRDEIKKRNKKPRKTKKTK